MNKKRKAILVLATATIGIVIGLFILHSFTRNKNDKYVKSAEDGDITRYEWMEMLCNQQGLTEYQNKMPYFSDVNEKDTCFPYIQSAVEWGLLNVGFDFEGDGYASGRFIALTAMKTIGERKLQIYLGTEDIITEDAYIELAVEHGLIEKTQLVESFSEEECQHVLEALKNAYFNVFWKDDYLNVVYQDGVIELSLKEVLQSNADCSEIVVTQNTADSLETGTVIVFEHPATGLKAARRIAEKNVDGTLLLNRVELNEIVESLVISDITELTFENIVNYYGLEEDAGTASNLMYQLADENIVNTKVFPIDVPSKGFKLSLSTEDEDEEKSLTIQVTKHDTGESYKIPVSEKIEVDCEYNIEIDIDKIFVGGQVDFSLPEVINYADVAIDAHATFTGTIKAEAEKKIPLIKTPVRLGNGIAAIDVQVYLVLSLEGGISFEAELPMEMSVYYENGKGFRNFNHKVSVKDPAIEVNCEAGVAFRPELTFVLFSFFDVLDAELDVGVEAGASSTTRPNSQICIDISVVFPVITVSVCGDDDADTAIGKFGWSMEREIYSSDNAPVQFGLHYERLSAGSSGFVDKCTYKEEDTGNGPANGMGSAHTYKTRYGEVNAIDYPIFQFDYSDNWAVTQEEFDYDLSQETVIISNARGVKITYRDFGSINLNEVGGAGRDWMEAEVSKVADSNFDSGDFMVAEIKTTRELMAGVDGDWVETDGTISYAVLPESYVGTCTMNGLIGIYEELSFKYLSSSYMFIAEALDGRFTDEEKEEVLAILASFRVANRQTPAAEEDQIYAALQGGDFSYFAGIYKPCGIYDDWYGGGEPLLNLILQENGIIIGGGMWFDENPYPATEPISVIKREDGSYLCQVTYTDEYLQKYFLIYPQGVIGENPYIYNDPLLTEKVYIQYMVFDGGVGDIIYYKIED